MKIFTSQNFKVCKILCIIMLSSYWLSANSLEKTLDLMEKQEFQDYIQEEQESFSAQNIHEENKLEIKNNSRFIFERIVLFNKDSVVSNVDYILKKFTSKEIGVNEIYSLVEELTDYFLDKGYSTTAIGIRKIDTENKTLELEVYDGLVNEIILNGKKDSLRVFFGMPLKKGEKFNIFDLDMGIENLSEVSEDIDVSIQPSSQDGYSDIVITDQIKPIGLSASIDNSGVEDKGTYKINLGVSLNNITNTNDTLKVSLNTYPIQKKHSKEYGVSTNYTLPFRYNQFYVAYQFLQATDTSSGFLVSNQAHNYLIGYKRFFDRSQSSKKATYINFLIKQRINKISDLTLLLSSKTYGSAVLGFEYSKSLHQGFFYISFEYERGIPLSKQDERSVYKMDYNKININSNFQYSFPILKNLYMSYRGTLGGSYSDCTLLGLNKFSIGDEYSVRGFKKYSVDLDYGLYVNNTLSLGFSSKNKFLQDFQLFSGFDFGWGRDYLLPSDDVLVGTALGVRYTHPNINASLTVSRAIHKPTSLPSNGYPVYLRIGVMM